MAPCPGPLIQFPAGWTVAAVRPADPDYRAADHSLLSLLPESSRERRQVLRPSALLQGFDVGHRAFQQPVADDDLLGTDQSDLVPVDQLLDTQAGRPSRCPDGPCGHWWRWPRATGRHTDHWQYRRQLRTR